MHMIATRVMLAGEQWSNKCGLSFLSPHISMNKLEKKLENN